MIKVKKITALEFVYLLKLAPTELSLWPYHVTIKNAQIWLKWVIYNIFSVYNYNDLSCTRRCIDFQIVSQCERSISHNTLYTII